MPTAMASTSVSIISQGWAASDRSPSVSDVTAPTLGSTLHTTSDSTHAATAVSTPSPTRPSLIRRREAPTMRRAFSPLMRIGLSASVKFRKLMAARAMTSRLAIPSRYSITL